VEDLTAHNNAVGIPRAENGNVALTPEIDLLTSQGEFVLALGLGEGPEEAAQNAVGTSRRFYKPADYVAGWQNGWGPPTLGSADPLGDSSQSASPSCDH